MGDQVLTWLLRLPVIVVFSLAVSYLLAQRFP